MRSKNKDLMEKIKLFIESCFNENYRMPTVREIGKAMGISPSCVHRYLVEMNERNIISYSNGKMSTERIESMKLHTNNAALIGSIPCGTPDIREAFIEDYLPLPVSVFGTGELYILRAEGDSMIGVGIDDGDLVVIKQTNHANVGDIVVALDGDSCNTLKTLCFDDKKSCYYLHPENDRYEDMYLNEIVIQGVAKHIIKTL